MDRKAHMPSAAMVKQHKYAKYTDEMLCSTKRAYFLFLCFIK